MIEEHDLRYAVDIVEGQKTGFFLDQRDNRREAARYGKRGGRVLDLMLLHGRIRDERRASRRALPKKCWPLTSLSRRSIWPTPMSNRTD